MHRDWQYVKKNWKYVKKKEAQAFCDPTAFPAQLCPDNGNGQSECPQCGKVKCPCPE